MHGKRDRQIIRDIAAATDGGVHLDKGNRQRLERLPYRDGLVRWAMYDETLSPKQRTALQMYYLPDWRNLPRPTEAECADVLGITREAFADRLDAAERRALGPAPARRRALKSRGEPDPEDAVDEILRRLWMRTYGANDRPGRHVGENYMPWRAWTRLRSIERMMRPGG